MMATLHERPANVADRPFVTVSTFLQAFAISPFTHPTLPLNKQFSANTVKLESFRVSLLHMDYAFRKSADVYPITLTGALQ